MFILRRNVLIKLSICLILFLIFLELKKIIDKRKFLKHINRREYNVDCELIQKSNEHEILHAKYLLQRTPFKQINDEYFVFNAQLCATFLKKYNYSSNINEKDFSLAYSILTYENVDQFERLLRVIYRPQNIYCIHVDAKSTKVFKKAISSLTNCFDNVFIATKLEEIVYASYSRLQADINCIDDLMYRRYVFKLGKRLVKWRYLINLASTEYPLKTNREIVDILRLYNGANDIEVLKVNNYKRFMNKYEITSSGRIRFTSEKKNPFEYKVYFRKGSAYGAFSYEFLKWMLTNEYSIALRNWFNDTFSPDETYWATLQSNVQFKPPGGHQSTYLHRYDPVLNYISKFTLWQTETLKCNSYFKRELCIFSMLDLPLLVKRPELFVNKLSLNADPIVYKCLNQWLHKKDKENRSIDTQLYLNIPIVKAFNKNKP